MAEVRRVCALIVLAAVLLAGCRVDARVDVTLRGNGSGTVTSTVTFDADAVQRLGGSTVLARTARFGDLKSAGWTVSPITPGAAATSVITLSHPFANQADLAQRLTDLAGPNGVLRDPHIANSRGWVSSTTGLTLVIDMRAPSPGITSDAALTGRLRAAGIDPVELEARLTRELRVALHLTVAVRLPDGQTRTFTATNGTLVTADLTRHATDWNRIVKLGIAGALVALAGAFMLAAAMSARRDRRRRRERVRPEPERVPLM